MEESPEGELDSVARITKPYDGAKKNVHRIMVGRSIVVPRTLSVIDF